MKRRIPHNVRQLVEKQFERLTPETRRILIAASVAGVEFSTAAVAATVGGDAVGVEACCEELVQHQQFLRPIGPGTWPDGTVATRYGFRHALAREAVQERVSLAQRRRLHQQIGERLEIAYGSQVDGSAAELAVHFAGAQDYHRAVQSTGTEIGHSRYLAALAEVYGKLGQAGIGLPLLDEALAEVERGGERFYEAELYRLKGQLTLQQAEAGGWRLVPPPPKPQVSSLKSQAR